MKSSISILATLLLAAGCSTLSVRVDIVNPAVVQAHVDELMIRDVLPIVRAQSDSAVNGFVDAIEDEHRKFYIRLDALYRADAVKLSDKKAQEQLTGLANQLLTGFDVGIDPLYRAARTALNGVNAEIRRLDALPDGKEKTAQLASRLHERDAQLANLRVMIQRDSDEQTALAVKRLGPSREIVQAQQTLVTAEQSKTRGLIGTMGLVESAEAYRVVSAPDTDWHQDFDQSFGRSRFGDMNLAIKMEHPGNFTIKGVTFDPSEVVRVASKATTQALVFSAQLAGAPLKTKQHAASETTSAASSSGELVTLEEEQAQREAKAGDRNAALLAIANVILTEQTKLKGSDAERAAAIKAIKDAFDAHKARLTQ
jgi:hypothetical protein